MLMCNCKMKILFFSLYLLFSVFSLFAFGQIEAPKLEAPKMPELPVPPELEGLPDGSEIRIITAMQDTYNSIPASVPALCLLPVQKTSAVNQNLCDAVEEQISRQLTNRSLIKPITMNVWLQTTFGKSKARTPFSFFSSIVSERYVVPLQYFCRPYIFKNGNTFGIHLNFYELNGTYYPITVIRFFSGLEEVKKIVEVCLDEFEYKTANNSYGRKTKKIIVNDFSLEIRKLVELESGEFEFVSSPFIEQDGVALRLSDDYFSSLMAYSLTSTTLFSSLRMSDFSGYSETVMNTSNNADYIVNGRIQLTNQICIMYIDFYSAKTGSVVFSVKHPVETFSVDLIWDACRYVSSLFISSIFNENEFDIVSPLELENYSFYLENSYLGHNMLSHFVLPKGMYIINTGTKFKADDPVKKEIKPNEFVADENKKTFYVFLDSENHVFTNREGEYVWNLLQKDK